MDFTGADTVILLPGTEGYPMGFLFAACTTAEANDGSIPFGATISSAAVQVLDKNGADVSASIVPGVPVVSGGLRVDITLDYPSSPVVGRCKVYVLLTLSTGAVLSKLWEGLRLA